MKLKFGPCLWNPYAAHNFPGCLPDTVIEVLNENTLRVDGELHEFDEASVAWPEVSEQTGGRIIEARRDDDGELWLTVRRFYSASCGVWDTEDYHEVTP
jgi:hypothetical protein